MKIFKFRNCLLNSLERTVLRDGKRLDLTPKTFDVLQMLVERAGELVTKDEILGNVWNGSFVEEGNLPVHVAKLRRQLDGDRNNRFIETVHGGGYRFTANVEVVGDDVWQKQFAGFNRRKTDRQPEPDTFDSIAVLPLSNETNDVENDYLADGLTESLINRLSRTTNLRVMARDTVFRYKNKNTDAKEVGDTLGVAAVLTGRVKLVKDNLLIGVELVKVADGSQLWGKQFDQPFSDIIKIKDSIASTVTEQLRSRATRLAASPQNNAVTKNAESYRLYLKGKYFQETHTEKNLFKAIAYFRDSILNDSENVHSQVCIIEAYLTLYFFDYISYDDWEEKTSLFRKSVSELSQSVDVLQVIYAKVKMYINWEFDGVEEHIQAALNINRSCLAAHILFSEFCILRGRFDSALDSLEKVVEIDPLSTSTYKRIGRLFYHMREYDEAKMYLLDAIELNPADYETHFLLGMVLTGKGDHAGALKTFVTSLYLHHNFDTLAMIGYINALMGNADEANKVIELLKSKETNALKFSIKLARIYCALGHKKLAYKHLDLAYEEHEPDLLFLNTDSKFEPIKHETRFRKLVRNIGLPSM
ncbi:MAG: winged helix-turn-helix domain-containing tetratricopeptide repeat protein [Pyrinomonadaceae bacterium]